MKVTGIIAEYNPFHNGHQYHIEETRRITKSDYIIAIMSGDFVQRGAPAILDKYERARCALFSGCDLVIELPVIYSTASAEFFADGAVTALDRLGIVDYLSFGSEKGSLAELSSIADILTDEPQEYKTALQELLKSGLSYPAARIQALKHCTSPDDKETASIYADLSQANNILALEYLKSLKKNASTIKPFTIQRKTAAYHDLSLEDSIASATAIRNHLLNIKKNPSAIAGRIPDVMLDALEKNAPAFPDFDQLTPYLHSILLHESSLEQYLDWDEALSNRLRHLPVTTLSYSEIITGLKSRHLTQTRIQRALIHLLLDIKTTDFFAQYRRNPVPYVKILGFRKESSPLLKELKKHSSIPLITKPASIHKLISPDDMWIWKKDDTASRLYQSLFYTNWQKKLPSAYLRTPIIL